MPFFSREKAKFKSLKSSLSEASSNWNPNLVFAVMIGLAQNRKIKISVEIDGCFAESGAHLTPQRLGGKWMVRT